jgi:hypothetical protein
MNEVATVALAVPTLRGAFRLAATDFYYQSLRLVPANVAWGASLLGVLAIAFWWSPTLALVIAPLLCLPLVGIVRLAAQIVRGDDVVLSDITTAMRSHGLMAVAAGVVFEVATLVAATNVVAGISGGGATGWAFAVLAGWGLVALWVVGLAFWPLIVDPAREAMPVAARARLAGLVVLAHPARFASLGASVALVTIVSAVAFAALLSVSVAFIALVASRVTLPSADQLETRLSSSAATPGAIGQA